jgi:hypothetical protein
MVANCLSHARQRSTDRSEALGQSWSEGRILTRNWELYDGQHVVFAPLQMTPQQLQAGHERAWREVYSYGAIVRRLAAARTQLPIAVMANLGYRYYARHLETHYNCDWPIGFREAA